MGSIYSEASRVLVWLGTRDLSFQRLCQADENSRKTDLQSAKISESRRKFQPIGASIRKEMKDLFSNEYWSRMWIVQEYLLARKLDLMTGTDVLEGHLLARLCDLVGYRSQLSPMVRNIIAYHQEKEPVFAPKKHVIGPRLSMVHHLSRPVSYDYVQTQRRGVVRFHPFPYEFSTKNPVIPVSLVFPDGNTHGLVQEDWFEILSPAYVQRRLYPLKNMLLAFGSQRCKEQVDRVYGLLSLVTKKDCSRFGLAPDYSKSPSVLFVELAYGFHMKEGSETGTVTSRRIANILGLQKTLDVEFTLKRIRKDIDMDQVTSPKSLAHKAQEKMAVAVSPTLGSDIVERRVQKVSKPQNLVTTAVTRPQKSSQILGRRKSQGDNNSKESTVQKKARVVE